MFQHLLQLFQYNTYIHTRSRATQIIMQADRTIIQQHTNITMTLSGIEMEKVWMSQWMGWAKRAKPISADVIEVQKPSSKTNENVVDVIKKKMII